MPVARSLDRRRHEGSELKHFGRHAALTLGALGVVFGDIGTSRCLR